VREAEEMIAEEMQHLELGGDPEAWDHEENKAKYLRPVPKIDEDMVCHERFVNNMGPDEAEKRRIPRMANLVEVMMKMEAHKKEIETSGENGKLLFRRTSSGKTVPSRTCSIL